MFKKYERIKKTHIGRARKQTRQDQLPGAQRDTDDINDDEGHGAAMLSLKSQIKPRPVELSMITSAGKLRSRHPTFKSNHKRIIDSPFGFYFCVKIDIGSNTAQ